MPRPARSQFKAAHVTVVQLKLFVLAVVVTSWGVRYISCSSVRFGEKGSSRGHVNKECVGVGVSSEGEGCCACSVAGSQWSAVCCEAKDKG